MKKFRSLLIAAVSMTALSGVASADVIISYTTAPFTQATDLTNQLFTLTAWNPGGTGTYDTVASDSTSYVSGQSGFQAGVTMASLDASGVSYTLHSYDIYVGSTLQGTYSVTAGAGGSTGSVNISSAHAVSLGTPMGGITGTADDPNDLYHAAGDGFPNGAPAPATGSLSANLTPGQSTGATINSSKASDLGFWDTSCATFGCTVAGVYDPLSSNLALVDSTDPLNFYISTLTTVNTSLSGGDVSSAKATSVSELITVVYDFTTSTSSVSSATPEPTTMVLFGSALVGLGLYRRRSRQQA